MNATMYLFVKLSPSIRMTGPYMPNHFIRCYKIAASYTAIVGVVARIFEKAGRGILFRLRGIFIGEDSAK